MTILINKYTIKNAYFPVCYDEFALNFVIYVIVTVINFFLNITNTFLTLKAKI